MKLIIAGSRNLNPKFEFIEGAILLLEPYMTGTVNTPISEIVSGAASGVDREGEHWASHRNVPVKRFPADWKKHGKAAGPLRNKEMAKYADALLLIWDGESRGSKNMKHEMMIQGKPVYEVILRRPG